MKNSVMYLCLSFIGLFNISKAQDISKLKIQLANKSYEYYEMKTDIPAKGILILLPAAGEKANSIFKKTRLPVTMATNGYITLIPEITTQMFADKDCINKLNELIKVKMLQFKLAYKDIVIGGLSNGGAIALCYIEYLNSQTNPIKIKGVFAIDPPADLARVYRSAENKMNYSCTLISREGKTVKAYLDHTLDGSPVSNPQMYYKYAAYSADAADGGNAKFLKDIPVKLYCEPDLKYVQKTYCDALQYADINAFDLDKLAIFLKDVGNEQVEYIKTEGREFHSWNIVVPEDCTKWILSL